MGFYQFNQNNSGGYILNDNNVAEYVFIEADSAIEANQRAESLGMFSLPFCECCGERFWRLAADDKPLQNGDKIDLFTMEDKITILYHFKNDKKEESFDLSRGRRLSAYWEE